MLPSSVRRLSPLASRAPPGRTSVTEAREATFREAMLRLPSGVSILTVGAGPERTGLTATSVTPLSAEPPTLLVCIDRAAANYAALMGSEAFAVNVLAADQRELAELFVHGAGFPEAEGAQDGRWLVLPSGTSCLADSVAVFDCTIEERIERHAHAIVIGRVRRALTGGASGALVLWRGAYDQVGWSADEISRAIGLSP